jgi:hypothetical protein
VSFSPEVVWLRAVKGILLSGQMKPTEYKDLLVEERYFDLNSYLDLVRNEENRLI